jgi:uncharacterized repeat protein (TIGR01451 family)
MISRTHSLFRMLLTMALAGLVLALLPLALTAQPQAVPVNHGAPDSSTATTHTLAAQTAITMTPELAVKLHPAVLKQWLSSSGDLQPVIIQMRAQAKLNQAAITDAPSVVDRRSAIVAELQATAQQSQAGVLALLDGAQQANRASEIRSLWINNSIAAHVDRDTLLQIAARPDVAFIQPDQYHKWIDTPIALTSTLQAPTSIQWNIQRIRADQVWSVLNISGTGVVVGNMDTGVDWQHPALSGSYRGSSPKGLPNHLFSWFDATTEQTLYPYDGFGHGTHTMGILVGAGGIGVAPGAKWIAARIFDSDGFAYNSWIHAGFQWMLAPGGDPSQAPDVLSNSWGNNDGSAVEFQPEVRLLNAAGIDTYFSNGNGGPDPKTVGSPASFPEAFGVGAVDDTDWIANFSSRGPSPLGPIKPDVSAPGVSILSSIPGGGYLKESGTSMAAPQVAGIAALMRSAVPGLTITQTRYALTTTAMQIVSATYPNNDYGWGRVDAFNAVVSVMRAGSISGVVRRSDTDAPIPFALVRGDSRLGTWSSVIADETGRYTLYGAASLYTLTASAFGYVSHTLFNVPIVTNTTTSRDVRLDPLPQGWVTGRVTDITGTRSLTASLSVLNTPVTITAQGVYSWALPVGTHVLRAQANAHRIVTAEVTLAAGQTITQNFALPDAPRILLVDSGRWYNGSAIQYYRQALDDLNYLYDEWPIRDLNVDLPTTRTLRSYNAVIWSAPLDSPGLIGSGNVLSDYLGTGGHLMLSGQDVGFYDDGYFYDTYYHSALMAQFVADSTASRQLTGARAFAGLTLNISGTGGADNQLYPDVIASRVPTLTEEIFNYDPTEIGGLSVGLCRPYRAVYLPFGFEAINDRVTRAEVLSRTFGTFNRSLQRNVFAFDPTPDRLIAPPGSLVTDVVTLNNFDEVAPLTFTLSAQSAWNVTLAPAQFSLKPCESRPITITVRIPVGAMRDASQPVTITASTIGLPVTSTVLLAKAPASVLLVQDDRWYPVDAPYRSALAANGIPYDLWRVPTSWAGPEPAAPSANRMSWYPQVIWFTGYDWYQTLTPSNTQTLQTYLRQGGRLLLSSQDFMSTEGMDDFKRNTLGVMTATADLTTALVSGVQGGLFDGLIQQPLNLPYPNYDAALVPQPGAQVELVGDHGWPIALSHDMGISKTLFMAFGFEGLPPPSLPDAMNRAVGFLSRLGRSSVKTDRELARPGDAITATIAVMNDSAAPIDRAAFTLTLPSSVTYLSGDALTWSGALSAGQIATRHMQLKLANALSAGTIITLPVEFRDDDQVIGFMRAARINVGGPQLELSYAPDAATALINHGVTWTLSARNSGALTAPVTVTLGVPFEQTWISGSLQATSGTLITHEDRLEWFGTLGLDEVLRVTYRLTTPWTLTPLELYGSAIAATDHEVWQAGSYWRVMPFQTYLPVVRK